MPICRRHGWLAEERRARRERRLAVLVVFGGAGLVLLFGGALVVRTSGRGTVARAEVAAEAELGPALTGEAGGASVVGVPMPTVPRKGWKRPPCTRRSGYREEELNGACWLRLDFEPGPERCGPAYYHEGRCYVPVGEPAPTPRVLHP